MPSRQVVSQFKRTRTISASLRAGLWAALLASSAFVTPANAKDQAQTCESFSSLKLPNTVITAAQSIPVGGFQPPGSTLIPNLPAFCRVTATISPVPDSSIGIEVWLPTTTWNGKYQQSGNHGFGGTFFWGEMASQIRRGYATGITDDGHSPGGFAVSWAIGHPEKVKDLAYRAVHELAEKAKLIVTAYYGDLPRYSYFNGCSDGGREAFKEAQVFPRDFDGIIAGGAASFWTHAATQQLVASLNRVNTGMTSALMTVAQNGATAACDALDGVVDGLITDPRRCHFDARTLICKGGQSSNCLTPAQANAINTNNSTLVDPVTGQFVFSGISRAENSTKTDLGLDWLLSASLTISSLSVI